MDETKALEFGARALLPAVVASAAIWFTGFAGVQSSPFLLFALFACYLAGFAALACASELKLQKTLGFYAFYILLVLAGVFVAGGFLQRNPAGVFGSILAPIAVSFMLPAVFEFVRERIRNVHGE